MSYKQQWPTAGGSVANGSAASAAPPAEAIRRPICVDLERVLLKTDACWESALLLAKQAPWHFAVAAVVAAPRPGLLSNGAGAGASFPDVASCPIGPNAR